MESFSNIINNFKIKCYDDIFKNIILQHYNIEYTDKDDIDTLHIGLNSKIKIKNNTNILILGPECDNPSFFGFLVYYKEKINFFTLSQIDADFYKKNHDITSTTIQFNFPKITENTKKLIYFNRLNYDKSDNNKDFLNYILYCYTNNLPFYNIQSLKIILFENLNYIQNPYVNILYTSYFEKIKIRNFYKITTDDYLQKLKKTPNNIIDKFHFFKLNFFIIKNYINLIKFASPHIKSINSTTKYTELNYSEESEEKQNFITLSDDLQYLQNMNNEICLKIYIQQDEIFTKKNNIIYLNKFFLEPKNIEENDSEFHFIISNKDDIKHLTNYLNLFQKYIPNKIIKIFSDFNIPNSYSIDEFIPEPNTKIFFSKNFNLDKYLTKLIFLPNIEIQQIQKIHTLVCSSQYPSYGGAATNAYNIIKYLQKNKNIYTTGLFINIDSSVYENCNPDNIDNIVGLLYNDFNDIGINLFLYKKYKSIPDIAFCKNSMAPKIIKKIFPNCIIVFLVSGIMGFSQIDCGANELKELTNYQKKQEINSIEVSNLIICNSQLTLNYYKKIYPNIISNNLHYLPVDTTKYNTHLIPTKKYKKTIDIIIVASNVNRPVKNIKFIKQLISSSKKLQNRRITIIGENSEDMFQNLSKKITILPLLKQQEVDSYLLKSKIILIPSLFDSNSNTFREAVIAKVLPFISVNVAHPRKYPKFFIQQNYDINEWDERINYTLDNYKEISQKYHLEKYFQNSDNITDFIL